MDSKRILKLDKDVIDKAKTYASLHQRSLSRIIESYLRSLVDKENQNPNDDIEISPFVESIRTGVSLPSNLDDTKEYMDFLVEKYRL
ncbi:MAG: DUF6364 family protein [Bacteroidota bacterium]